MAAQINDASTVGAAKQWLRERWHKGAACPVCTQTVKVYRRKLNASMARALLSLYRQAGTSFVFAQQVWSRTEGKNVTFLRWWGLLEAGDEPGWWRVTEPGAAWLIGQTTVPSHVLIYDRRCLGLDGDPIRFDEALGEPFDFAELMAERPFNAHVPDQAPALFDERSTPLSEPRGVER